MKKLPVFVWLWIPILVVPVQVAAKAVGEDFFRATLRGELAAVENLTVVFLIVAIVLALRLFARRDRVEHRLFGRFMLVMAAGCFFFAGEEASWGQHWFGFEPPEGIAARNDQGEFNLHNDPFLERLLDQPPRLALTLAALVGGIIVPLMRRKRGCERPRFDTPKLFDWVWPTIECLPAAVVVLTVTVPKKIFRAVSGEVPELLDIRPGETKEMCLALFLMAYLAVMFFELRAATDGERAAQREGGGGA